MYKNILIPVSFDATRNTDAALQAAAALGAGAARLSLLHVLEPIPVFAEAHVPVEIFQAGKDEMQSKLDALAAANPNAEGYVAKGHPGRKIIQWAEEHGADCIVIASHQPDVTDYLLGSTAQYVVRHARCAVHVIR